MVRPIERTAEERVRDRELSAGPRGVRDFFLLLRRHHRARDDNEREQCLQREYGRTRYHLHHANWSVGVPITAQLDHYMTHR